MFLQRLWKWREGVFHGKCANTSMRRVSPVQLTISSGPSRHDCDVAHNSKEDPARCFTARRRTFDLRSSEDTLCHFARTLCHNVVRSWAVRRTPQAAARHFASLTVRKRILGVVTHRAIFAHCLFRAVSGKSCLQEAHNNAQALFCRGQSAACRKTWCAWPVALRSETRAIPRHTPVQNQKSGNTWSVASRSRHPPTYRTTGSGVRGNRFEVWNRVEVI